MRLVDIYTRTHCNYCVMAKRLLDETGYAYTEHKLDVDFTREQLLESFPHAKSYPIIVVDGYNIGGFAELAKYVEAQSFIDSKQVLNEG
jgi:glutaredoxin 3